MKKKTIDNTDSVDVQMDREYKARLDAFSAAQKAQLAPLREREAMLKQEIEERQNELRRLSGQVIAILNTPRPKSLDVQRSELHEGNEVEGRCFKPGQSLTEGWERGQFVKKISLAGQQHSAPSDILYELETDGGKRCICFEIRG